MKKFSLATVVLSLLLTNAASAGRHIIEAKDGVDITSEVSKQGGRLIRNLESGRRGYISDLSENSIKKLRKKFPDLKITPDIKMKLTLPVASKSVVSKSTQTVPWGLQAIRANYAHRITKGKGVRVCIVDTGIDRYHYELYPNIVGGRNFVANNGVINPRAYGDENGHGTHVAGIIAARDNGSGVVGVAPLAQIYAVKVLDADGGGYLSDVADGVLECVRAKSHVINLSLGAASDPNLDSPLKRAIANAINAGVTVVVAAGNEGMDIAQTIPAGYEQTLAVAAIDSKYEFPWWTNFGLKRGDASAPGVAIESTWPDNKFAALSGTSMAAPHVTGVVALAIASRAKGMIAVTLGKDVSIEGEGLIDAYSTVVNR